MSIATMKRGVNNRFNNNLVCDMSDNELIAEFMGFEVSDTMPISHDKIYSLPYVDTSLSNHYFGPHRSEQMNFDSSWDWLMPVVEKISKHVYESYSDNNGYKDVTRHDRAYPRTFGMIDSEGKWMVRINRMPLEQEDTLIQATYKAVVEFIKWYNSVQEPRKDEKK